MLKKSLGQVLLVDNNILHKIIRTSGVTKNDHVVEIGCGEGVLSRELAAISKSLTIIEIDSELLQKTAVKLEKLDTVHYIHGDVLKTGWESIPYQSFKLVANIPYYISAKIMKWVITHKDKIENATIMVQREFAKKLLAAPGEKLYCSLNIYASFYLDIQKLFDVSRRSFKPIPKVDSTVIQLTPREQPLFSVDEDLFFSIVRAAFWGRRKKLLTCLLKNPFRTFPAEIASLPFFQTHPNIRGESMGVEAFYGLYLDIQNVHGISKRFS